MPYSDVGLQSGVPSGVLLPQKNVTFSNVPFVVKTTVRNIDDPFDGTQGGTPNDTAPADYKLVEIEVSCPTCARFIPARMTTTVAPPVAETATNNGTLLIKVFNASGQPVAGANVSVINNSVSPAVNLNDVTDSNGMLNLIDVSPSPNGYAITITKTGYSTDRTYLPGALANPNPLKPHATVLSQQVTEISFVIDIVSSLTIKTQDKFCNGLGSVDIVQTGQKLIGTNPDVVKYSATYVTDAGGNRNVTGLEFDAYSFKNQDTVYELNGFTPLAPLAVDPNGSYNLTWLMSAKNPSAIVVTVIDELDQPINDAKITLTKAGFSSQQYTGRKIFTHTDWATGQYDSKSTNMNVSIVGKLELAQINGKYASMSDEWLISNTIDFGTINTNFYNLNFNPTNQPGQTSLKIQLAANNDNSTWNFVGPDGTASSFYTVDNTLIHASLNNKRYLRYKIILRTENHNSTSSLEDLTFNFHSDCIPDGQSYFDGLTQATYTIQAEKSGYTTFSDTGVIVDENWEDYQLILQQ